MQGLALRVARSRVGGSMIRRFWLALSLLLGMCTPIPVFAGPPLPGQPNWITAELPGAPTTVVVDVVEIATGTQVGNNLATSQVQRDAADTIGFKFDLSTVTGYPTNCAPKSYYVTFVPDSANCSEAGTPELCATTIVDVGGSACLASSDFESPSTIHSRVVVSAQGITQEVIDYYNRRGILPVKWQKFVRASDMNFASPDYTVWLVYFYTATNAAPRIKCVVPTATDPASALPSSSHCEG